MNRKILWLPILAFIFIATFPFTFGEMSPYQHGVMIIVGVYVILAVSLDLLMGITGLISLGHSAFFAIGAYTSGILTANYGVPPTLALLAGLLLSGLVAWLVGKPVLKLKGYYLVMATMGLSTVVFTLLVGLEELTGGASGLRNIPSFDLFGLNLGHNVLYYYFVWIMVFLVVFLVGRIVHSPLGRTLLAIHSDETVAGSIGIDYAGYKLRIFILTSIIASLAGSLLAHYIGFIAPDDFNVSMSIFLMVMVFLGGVGTIYGAVIGAAFLKIMPELTYSFHDYELLINGLILIFVLVFLPNGLISLFGNLKKLLNKLRLSMTTDRSKF